MVLAICRRLLRDATEAEDAAQQTFLSAQRALQNGSRPREPAAWLATIARNECVARTRARMREPLPTDVEPAPSGADAHSEAVRRENVESLRDAIGSLPDQQREAILLRELRGLSYDEVAASLALSPSAVESLLFRARKGLQLRLRNAWAALSPVGWLATVRELSAQAVAGGDPGVGPAAAKAVVIGLGTAVIAGGALVGPDAAAPRPTARVAGRSDPEDRGGHAPGGRCTRRRRAGSNPGRAGRGAGAAGRRHGRMSSRPARTPATVHTEDRTSSSEPSAGEEGSASAIWTTQKTEREDSGSSRPRPARLDPLPAPVRARLPPLSPAATPARVRRRPPAARPCRTRRTRPPTRPERSPLPPPHTSPRARTPGTATGARQGGDN